MEKIGILTLGDDPRHLSGVAHCLKDICESLLATGRFRIISLGAAIKHMDMRPVKLKEDWVVVPVEGFGTIEQVKGIVKENDIKIVLFQSDPRFYDWLLCRENEIRSMVPLIWYTVWDNYPYPVYNDWIWNSVDVSVAISQLTHDLIREVSPNTQLHYMPHCVNPSVFKKLPKKDVEEFQNNQLPQTKGKFVVFWNNRNGRRKNGASLIVWFNSFLDKVGRDKAVLLMNTDPVDHNGFNLPDIISGFNLNEQVFINSTKVDEFTLANFYNLADCTINISHSEGFGMGTLESLSCGTPIIATWTGGMREQLCDDIDDPIDWYGVPVFPASRAIVGSVELPWIYEEQVNEDGVVYALTTMYELPKEKREYWGQLGIQHVNNKFAFADFQKFWPDLLTKVNQQFGSFPNKAYIPWTEEIVDCKKKFESTKTPTDLPPSTRINYSHFLKFLDTLKQTKI